MADETFEERVARLGGRPQGGATKGYEVANGILHNIHSPVRCQGEWCCIHNPSGHHMLAWPQEWDDDRRRMMRVCEHEVAHVDPDEIGIHDRSRWAHPCDGCCAPPTGEVVFEERL